MSTHAIPALGDVNQDAGVFVTTIGTQLTAATAPSIGTQLCWVLADGGADEGIYSKFNIPKNYVGSPVMVAKGILDGAPGASDTLGFGVRKRAVANNEAADATFDAEQTVSATIGSSGSGHANEDEISLSITLTAGDYAVDDSVYFYLYLDASGTSYTGNFLLTDVMFEYADA